METRKILSSILLLAGEALIIICFLHFGNGLETKILTLNIVVSSVLFLLLFVDIINPFIDIRDESQKQIGSLGLRTFFTYGYVLGSIVAMILFNLNNRIDFHSQLLFHCIFLFAFLVSLYFVITAAAKVKEVYTEQTQVRSRINEMTKVTTNVMLKLEKLKNTPVEIENKVSALLENIRYLSVCNNADAIDLEGNYLKEMTAIHDRLFDSHPDNDKIIEHIQNCESTYKQRKQVYSN